MRERARYIGEAKEAAATSSLSPTRPHSKQPAAPALSQHPVALRTQFSQSEAEARRSGGFAYGGVYPGKRVVRGAPVENHEVRFSIGITGSYLLYVALRKPTNASWPSSGAKASVDDSVTVGVSGTAEVSSVTYEAEVKVRSCQMRCMF